MGGRERILLRDYIAYKCKKKYRTNRSNNIYIIVLFIYHIRSIRVRANEFEAKIKTNNII